MAAVSEHSAVIRDIDSIEEIHDVEELQKEVWGIPDIEVVPLSQLVAAKSSGGVLVGAFVQNALAGFAYGFIGIEGGEPVHHSHMLAVRPQYRSHDLGFRLKVAQRERVLSQGIHVMTWTFDPLQSLNAYFNINKLGAVSNRYYVNYYGEEAASFLHRNGTDRLWITWPLDSDRVVRRLSTPFSSEPPNAPRIVEIDQSDRPQRGDINEGLSGENVVLEIPADINALQQRDSGLAAEWREATRQAFVVAIDAGFIVKEFYRGLRNDQSFGIYLLAKGKI